MNVAYICSDPGVPIFGRKGCSIHTQEVIRAMLKVGCRIDLLATRLEGTPIAGLPVSRIHQLPSLQSGLLEEREKASMQANRALWETLTRLHLQEFGAQGSMGNRGQANGREGFFNFIYERYSIWSFAGMQFAAAHGIPGVLEVNAPLIEEQQQHRGLVNREAALQASRHAFRAARALVAVSDQVADYLDGYPEARGKILVVPNGIDPARFIRLSPAVPNPLQEFVIGFVGSLKPWHGLSILARAFAEFHKTHRRSRLLIVGEGIERSVFANALRQENVIEHVQFAGAVPPEEVPRYLASMNVAVAPYPALNGFYFSPLKVFEYMAAGLPVVASRIGQLEKIIESGVTGVLVPPGNPTACAAAMLELWQNPERARQMGEKGRALVIAHYTWEQNVRRILHHAAGTGRDPVGPHTTGPIWNLSWNNSGSEHSLTGVSLH